MRRLFSNGVNHLGCNRVPAFGKALLPAPRKIGSTAVEMGKNIEARKRLSSLGLSALMLLAVTPP
jgi:hypothetical protein